MFNISEGPFLISSEVNEQPVFWMAKKSGCGYELEGTESAKDASLFHILPVGDPTYPSDIHIAYWEERKYQTHVNDIFRTTKTAGPSLPYYVSVNSDTISGISDGSVSLETHVNIKQACFSLHCRLQNWFAGFMCTSTPVDLDSWLDGEQFYIKCSYHSLFNMKGYLAVKETSKSYKITTLFLATEKSSSQTGMLFRLHPKTIKEVESVNPVPVEEPDKTPSESLVTSHTVEASTQTIAEVSTQMATPVLDPITKKLAPVETPVPDPTTQEPHTLVTATPTANTSLSWWLLFSAIFVGGAAVLLFVVFWLIF